VGTDIPGTARVQGDEFTIQGLDGTSMYVELKGSFVAPARGISYTSFDFGNGGGPPRTQRPFFGIHMIARSP